jgi:hypothetical protein
VRAAFFAAAERCAAVRFRAAERACLESAFREAADRPSRLSAFVTARARFREVALAPRFAPFLSSRLALRRVCFEAAPFFGGGNFTPARRAFDKPIAIACLVDRAPCLPSRMCSISSRTNSPACAEGDFPSRSSSLALFRRKSKAFFRAPNWAREFASLWKAVLDLLPFRSLRRSSSRLRGIFLVIDKKSSIRLPRYCAIFLKLVMAGAFANGDLFQR